MADTIAAIATAPIKSAVGMIRISGDDALSVCERVFSKHLGDSPREMITGTFLSPDGTCLDFGMAVFFRGPKSFTGEDSVEFYCHGSVAVLREVLNSLFAAGARPAEPGEFTRRAFLNDKMDLTQAEAIIDLIDSETTLAARNAAEQLNGALGREISEISSALAGIAAEFYAFVDYPDDEIEQHERDELSASLYDIAKRARALSGSFSKGQLLKSGVRVAIIGRPNVGKSSVLNALLGTDRSIVTDIEGTTRDTVEESLSLNSIPLHLIDTAGLRDAKDEPERLGIERSRKAAEDADLLISVFDGAGDMTDYDAEVLSLSKTKPCICVINKSDLPQSVDKTLFDGLLHIFVSAKENSNIDGLKDLITEAVGMNDIPCDGKIITNPRHKSAIDRAENFIRSAADSFKNGVFPDLAVSDIESAINTLAEITGNYAQESVLSEIFSRFCVGK